MSTPSLFYVALTMVAAAATLPMVARQTPSLDSRIVAPQGARNAFTSQQRPELRTQMTSLQDMHERLVAAGPRGERRALMAESAHLMSDGVALMRRLSLALVSAAAESGEVRSEFITQTQSDMISDYLGLMELLVQLKGDREAIAIPVAPTIDAEPSEIQSSPPAPALARVMSLARSDAYVVGFPSRGSEAETYST